MWPKYRLPVFSVFGVHTNFREVLIKCAVFSCFNISPTIIILHYLMCCIDLAEMFFFISMFSCLEYNIVHRFCHMKIYKYNENWLKIKTACSGIRNSITPFRYVVVGLWRCRKWYHIAYEKQRHNMNKYTEHEINIIFVIV